MEDGGIPKYQPLNPTLWSREQKKKKRARDIIIGIISILMVCYIFIYGEETHIPYENTTITSVAIINTADNTNKIVDANTFGSQLKSLKLYRPVEAKDQDFSYKIVFKDSAEKNYELYVGDGVVMNDQGAFRTIYAFTDYVNKFYTKDNKDG